MDNSSSSLSLPFWQGRDSLITDEELRTSRLIFLHTDLGHNEVLERRKTFGRLLSTSGLTEVRTKSLHNARRKAGTVK